MFKRPHPLAASALGLAMAFSFGCDSEQPALGTKPDSAPAAKPLSDLAKDLKPPVVIKPNVSADGAPQPAQPPGGSR